MRIALIDPLSFVGKEISKLLPTWPGLSPASVDCFHTEADDEHQIAELGGEPALVPPLDDPGDLAHYDGVLIAADHEMTPRLEGLAEAIRDVPADLPVIDAARTPGLHDVTRVVMAPQDGPLRYRVPAPPLVAAIHVLEAIAELLPQAIAIHVEEPASAFGKGGIEELAGQVTARLKGEPPSSGVLQGILAFNLRSLPDGGLNEEAETLLAPLETSVTRSAVGRFHGHTTHLAIVLGSPTTAGAFERCCRSSERLQLIPDGLDLSRVPDSASVLVGRPAVSSRGRLVTVTTAVDGLLLGGARTALELLAMLV